jgi:hypothetical protein
MAYMRDGKLYEGGVFGAEIEEAVRGNAIAEEHARSSKTASTVGFVLMMAGLGGFTGGAAMGLVGSRKTAAFTTLGATTVRTRRRRSGPASWSRGSAS